MRRARLVVLVVCVAGCASATSPQPAPDAAVDAPELDAEVGLRCAVVTDPPLRTRGCYGGGYLECCSTYNEMQCALWGRALSDAGQSFAQCSFEPAACARADRCVFSDAGAQGPRICTCGTGPACGANQACVAAVPGAIPHCGCTVPAP